MNGFIIGTVHTTMHLALAYVALIDDLRMDMMLKHVYRSYSPLMHHMRHEM